jgi:uncharacterized protein
MRIEIEGQEFILLHHKAAYWTGKKTLLIGDLHLGKIGHFRKEGIAVPKQAADRNFLMLDNMLGAFDVQRIIFLGDLFHSSYNEEWEQFAAWRRSYKDIEMLIVLGNHDILPGWLFRESNIRVFAGEYIEDNFLFTHHPVEHHNEKRFVFAAHIHPVFLLKGKGRQALRLPCFMMTGKQMVLPSFGVFTGGYEISNMKYDHVFVVSGTEVLKL